MINETLNEADHKMDRAVEVTREDFAAIRTGRPLPGLKLPAGQTAMFDPTGTFLALYEPHGPIAKPTAVFVS